MFDEAGRELAFDDHVRRREPRFNIAAHNTAAGQDVAGAMRMDRCRADCDGFVQSRDRRQDLPFDGKFGKIEFPHDRFIADDKCHRLAAKPRDVFGEHRLIGERSDDPEAIFARHILGG